MDELRATAYLDQALELPVPQRDAWLREIETKDPHIAADLRRLLAAQSTERFAAFLNEQSPRSPPSSAYALPGELLGNYRILCELGQGGMAVVYLAERADGHYSQRVALKILRFGLEGSQAQFRFAQERQILASLDHPSIARLIDAGVTATGLPYLAMEYVENALPIDRYCDEQRLTMDARLRLFLKVADAVQYAHRHLIVHRDLKPSNIVITADGNVKLLDFGIAKLLAPTGFEHAAPPTREGLWLMTPEFASPEQARGQSVTTATDVYQLGLLLYGLLTGRPPYDVRGCKPIDALRVICESEPKPPALCRELDAILLKALRKESEHRYSSVGWLTDDIRRYQQGLTVSAYEGIWAYRAAKFFRRHAKELVVAGSAVLTIALIAAWYTVQLASERNRTRHEAASAVQVADFLASVFRGSSSRIANGNVTARELLDRGAARIETELVDQPEIKARLMNVIGEVYVQYDVRDKAQPLLERALQLNTRLFGTNSKEAADSQQALARLARDRGDVQRAKSLYEEVLRIRETTLGPRHVATADTWSELAATYYRLEQSAAATSAAERAIDIYTQSVGPDDERTLSATNNLAIAALFAGDLLRARKVFEELLPRIERNLGSEHRRFADVLGNLAGVRMALGDYDGVEQQLRRSIQILQRLYGPNHGNIGARRSNLGALFYLTGRLTDSIATFERIIADQRQIRGADSKSEADALWGIGLALRSRGEREAALKHFQAALDIYRTNLAASQGSYADVLIHYGETLLELGNPAAAGPVLSEATAIQRSRRPADHYQIATVRIANALLLVSTGKAAEAEPELRAAISTYKRVYPPEHPLLASARSALGESLLAQGKTAEAEDLLVSSAAQLRSHLHYSRRLALQRVIRLYELKDMPRAAGQYRDELAGFEQQVRTL